ncbi:galectin-9-like isoform X1 [Sinocyclocheilus rhinocerous]|uniref:galectin-9-like isoform X1 n=2 Tax=Sinocyclocheilus rhinocerous TaxID=307959 RepID=UPI0007BACC61|nr:PREDICTED: galectin-9-like isoform X1 [Sinocyclocheilus rhinocerous]
MYNIWAGLKSQLYLGYSASCFHIRGAPALVLNTQLKICIFDCRKTRIGRMAASEQQLAIYKPTTAITSIKGGLQEGKRVIIIGRILPDANRLHVNLQCGSDSDADIALHINPRYENDSAHVMYSTYKNGTWGSEQSTPDSPFVKDKLFAIEILVTKEVYKISANGKHLKDYEHHIPIIQVNTISVDQNIELEFIGYQNSVPPYKKELINGLKSDKNIVIYGIPNPDCKSIAIHLRHRYGVAFHYQCRFEENVVVRNTHENGSWGPEEKSEGIPFIQGQFFQAKVSCKAEQYDVSVNGQQAHTYKHRFTKLEDIDVVEVCGDLQLFSVEA